jgi:hypothetical protein
MIFLRGLYVLTAALCVFMVVWILIMPASWMTGRSKLHDKILVDVVLAEKHGVTPPETILKYEGHTAVHLTHILPGAFWCGLIPFQLHPRSRSKWPKLHRLFGYVFLASALVMTMGVFIILQRKLLFEDFFNASADDYEYTTREFLALLSLYFAGSALYSVKLARNQQLLAHQRWMIRHIAAGLWIAPQRLLLMCVYPLFYPSPVAPEVQRQSFGGAAHISMVATVLVSEYATHRIKSVWKEKRMD